MLDALESKKITQEIRIKCAEKQMTNYIEKKIQKKLNKGKMQAVLWDISSINIEKLKELQYKVETRSSLLGEVTYVNWEDEVKEN
jgi:acetylglutamate kinase